VGIGTNLSRAALYSLSSTVTLNFDPSKTTASSLFQKLSSIFLSYGVGIHAHNAHIHVEEWPSLHMACTAEVFCWSNWTTWRGDANIMKCQWLSIGKKQASEPSLNVLDKNTDNNSPYLLMRYKQLLLDMINDLSPFSMTYQVSQNKKWKKVLTETQTLRVRWL